MQLRFPAARLLPVTIVAMATLLGVKSVALVRAAVPEHDPPHAAASPPPRTRSAARVTHTKTACIAIAPTPGPAPQRAPGAAEEQLLLDLKKRNAALDARAAALDARQRLLQAVEKRLAARVTELKALENKLTAVAAGRRNERNANWQALVKLYESMHPRDAATIFDGLAMPVLLGVVHRMNERKAAAILAAMQPAKARALTTRLAALPLPTIPKGAGS